MSRNGDDEMTDAENDELQRRIHGPRFEIANAQKLPSFEALENEYLSSYIPTDLDMAMAAQHPMAVRGMERMQEKAENAALIAEYAAQCTQTEDRTRLAQHYFKLNPRVRVYTDDLRRLLELAKKGNQ